MSKAQIPSAGSEPISNSPSFALLAGDPNSLLTSSLGELDREDKLAVLCVRWPSFGDVGEGGIILDALCIFGSKHNCIVPYVIRPASSLSCCLLSATCAAITLCLSAMRLQSEHAQSRHLQNRLCPLRIEITPWFRQRAHLGERCVMDPIGGIGVDLISVEVGCNKNNMLAEPLNSKSSCQSSGSTWNDLQESDLQIFIIPPKVNFYIRTFFSAFIIKYKSHRGVQLI